MNLPSVFQAELLKWFGSYLQDRSQCVYVGKDVSKTFPVVCGVPQGSVLGPLLYTMYTKSIGEIYQRHNVLHHCYADDIQLYCAAEGSQDLTAKLNSINECIDKLKCWMGCNTLKLNSEKNGVHHISFEKVSWSLYDTVVALALAKHKHIFSRTVSGCNF